MISLLFDSTTLLFALRCYLLSLGCAVICCHLRFARYLASLSFGCAVIFCHLHFARYLASLSKTSFAIEDYQ